MLWALPTRIFHWGFAASIIASYVTGEAQSLIWHERFGLIALGFVSFRILWGFIGPREAHFANMLQSITIIYDYLRACARLAPPHYAGHNPLGGLSTIAMILVMAIMAISGLFMRDNVLYSAPLADIAPVLISPATWLHYTLHDLVLPLIALHIIALFVHRYLFGERLIRRMIQGVTTENCGGTAMQKWGGILLIVLCLFAAWSLTLFRVPF